MLRYKDGTIPFSQFFKWSIHKTNDENFEIQVLCYSGSNPNFFFDNSQQDAFSFASLQIN
jgi:hypothetical protein